MAGGRALFRLPVGSLAMKPARGASQPRAVASQPLSASVNILAGNDRSKWQTNMTVYSGVRFERVYPGIDLVYRSGNGQLEYDFIVSPGADPSAISLDFSGARQIELDAAGNLVFSLPGGKLQHRKPSVYQRAGDTRREISGRYMLAGSHRVRFEIGLYDRTLPLIIDPVVSYSTFLGGASDDGAFSVALDRDGNIYVAGITRSLNSPRPPAPSLDGPSRTPAMRLSPN